MLKLLDMNASHLTNDAETTEITPAPVALTSVTEVTVTPADVVYVGADGKWFRVNDRRVDLSRRRPLARILSAMAKSEARLAAAELIEAGWPGERIVRHAARIRLRVAVATLRSMGLAKEIVTTPIGYAFACRVVVEEDLESRLDCVTESGIPPRHVEEEDVALATG